MGAARLGKVAAVVQATHKSTAFARHIPHLRDGFRIAVGDSMCVRKTQSGSLVSFWSVWESACGRVLVARSLRWM